MLEGEKEISGACLHARVSRRVITSEFLKRTFLAEVDECQDCGIQLWTPETYIRFQEWMVNLKHEKRDLFQIQFYMPRSAREILSDLLRRYPGVPMSSLMRGITAVYLNSMTRMAGFQNLSSRLNERHSYLSVISGQRKKTSLHFNSVALLDVQTWAEVLKLPSHKVVEEALFKSLALHLEIESEFKRIWEQSFSPTLELILRAV
ncbi:MAG: hypothetical protein AB7G93_01530 [Bdellovibrionales bacterium]